MTLTLKSLTYSEFDNEERKWVLDGLLLGKTNLIVGKNATGKSRCLNVINGLAKLLSGKFKELFVSGSYDAIFLDEQRLQHRYQVKFDNRRVLHEQYDIADKRMLYRGPGGMGRIIAIDDDRELKFQTPDIHLAVVARQDSLQHPFLENLHKWATSVKHVESGKNMGQERLVMLIKAQTAAEEMEVDHVATYFLEGCKRGGDEFKKLIVEDMTRVGYSLEGVELRKPENIVTKPSLPLAGELAGIAVKEASLPCWTNQTQMSQGMYRALALVVHINYAIQIGGSHCFLIDDVGEGLDYERSCSLIDVMRDKLAGTESQLIMTTNNRFVMNKVPLEEWSVLQREGGTVRVRNHENSREAFEEFKFTGLSNFSFLETDFVSGPQPEEAVAR